MKKILIIGIIITIISILTYFIVGAIKRNPSVLIGEDTEYLYYKSYTLYNNDSCVNKYHKPITYEGVVIKKDSYRRKRGKHYRRVYCTVIRYNNSEKHTVNDWDYYSKHEVGDKVKIQKIFYPSPKIKTLN